MKATHRILNEDLTPTGWNWDIKSSKLQWRDGTWSEWRVEKELLEGFMECILKPIKPMHMENK